MHPDMGKKLQFVVSGYLHLAQMNTNPPTQNIGFSIAFHLHIHVHELEQAFNKLTSKANMYTPPIWANSYILW